MSQFCYLFSMRNWLAMVLLGFFASSAQAMEVELLRHTNREYPSTSFKLEAEVDSQGDLDGFWIQWGTRPKVFYGTAGSLTLMKFESSRGTPRHRRAVDQELLSFTAESFSAQHGGEFRISSNGRGSPELAHVRVAKDASGQWRLYNVRRGSVAPVSRLVQPFFDVATDRHGNVRLDVRSISFQFFN